MRNKVDRFKNKYDKNEKFALVFMLQFCYNIKILLLLEIALCNLENPQYSRHTNTTVTN